MLLLMLLLTVGTPLTGLQNGGPEVQGYIGVVTRGNPRTRSNGIEIAGVEPNGPADEAGIRPRDIIISVDGKFPVTIDELRDLVHGLHPGTRADVSYKRGALISETYIIVAAYPATKQAQSSTPRISQEQQPARSEANPTPQVQASDRELSKLHVAPTVPPVIQQHHGDPNNKAAISPRTTQNSDRDE